MSRRLAPIRMPDATNEAFEEGPLVAGYQLETQAAGQRNTFCQHDLGMSRRVARPVFGDEAGPKAVTLALIDVIGFDPVDAGPLSASWRIQILTPGFCTDLPRAALEKAARLQDNQQGYREPVLAVGVPDYRKASHLGRSPTIRPPR